MGLFEHLAGPLQSRARHDLLHTAYREAIGTVPRRPWPIPVVNKTLLTGELKTGPPPSVVDEEMPIVTRGDETDDQDRDDGAYSGFSLWERVLATLFIGTHRTPRHHTLYKENAR